MARSLFRLLFLFLEEGGIGVALEIFKLVGSIFVDSEKAEKSIQKTDKSAAGMAKTLLGGIGTAAKWGAGIVTAATGVAAAAGGALVALTEDTREYRNEMAKLETAFEDAELNAKDAQATYQDLNAVLGDSGQAVETSNHLALLCDNEQQLSTWTNICTGVYAKFGESLPIEGLAEAANETAKTGALTGGLADALNWAGVNEDKFQESLDKCNSEQERQALITETMNGLYSDAAAKYKENNKAILEQNAAQEKMNASMAKLGEVAEPIITKVKGSLADLLVALLPVAENLATTLMPILMEVAEDVVPLLQDALNEIIPIAMEMLTPLLSIARDALPSLKNAFAGIIPVIMQLIPIFMQIISSVLPVLLEVINQLLPPIASIAQQILPVISQLITSLMPIVTQIIEMVLPVITELLTTLIPPLLQIVQALLPPLLEVITALMPILQLAIDLLGPIIDLFMQLLTPIVSLINEAIAPLISIFADLMENYLKVFIPIVQTVADVLVSYLGGAITGVSGYIEGIIGVFKGLITFITGVFTGEWSTALEGLKSVASSIFEAMVTIVKAPINALISGLNAFIKGLNKIEIPDWVPEVGGKGLNIPTIPKLAKGGEIRTSGRVMVGEEGPEYLDLPVGAKVLPLKHPAANDSLSGAQLDTLVDLMNQLINTVAAGQNTQVVLNDGTLVGALTPKFDSQMGLNIVRKGRNNA